MAYTAEQKSQAKALVASYGNAAKAIPVLEEIWPEVPDPVTLWRWATNPAIQPDTRWVQDFATQINARVIGMVDSMLGPLKERIEGQIANGKSLDLHNDVRSFTFLTNLVRPANATGVWKRGHVH